MQEEIKTPIKYRLQKINTSKFNLDTENKSLENIDNVKIEFNINVKINAQKEIIYITLGVLIIDSPISKEHLCNLVVDFTFHVLGLKNVKKEGDKIYIPDNFITSLISISYGTLRGIFYEKCSTTCLSNIILPIIDPATLLPKKE